MAYFISSLGLIWEWRWDAAACSPVWVGGWVGVGGGTDGWPAEQDAVLPHYLMFIKATWLKQVQVHLRSRRLVQDWHRTSSAQKNEWWIMNQPSKSKSGTDIFKLNKQDMFTREALTAQNGFCQLYIHCNRKDRKVYSVFAEQLCFPLKGDKSPENRMGSVCFKTFCWSQTVTFHHMWAKSEALACFLHGHNAKQISSQRRWHAERPSGQETADDEGLGLGPGGRAEPPGHAVSGAVPRHIPAAWRTGEKNPQC